MRSSYGTNFSLTLFGESHGPAVGFVLDGLPAGIELDLQNIRDALTRRGITTTIRASRGEDIQAACGLLSTREREKREASSGQRPTGNAK